MKTATLLEKINIYLVPCFQLRSNRQDWTCLRPPDINDHEGKHPWEHVVAKKPMLRQDEHLNRYANVQVGLTYSVRLLLASL